MWNWSYYKLRVVEILACSIRIGWTPPRRQPGYATCPCNPPPPLWNPAYAPACQPLSSLPQQPQSHPHAAAAVPMTTLTFCVIFLTWWISSTNWFIKKNHCLGTPRSTRLFFTVHSHKSLLQTRGLLAGTSHLDTVLNNNLDQNWKFPQFINWRRLRECRTYDHVRTSAISSWRFESYGELSTHGKAALLGWGPWKTMLSQLKSMRIYATFAKQHYTVMSVHISVSTTKRV